MGVCLKNTTELGCTSLSIIDRGQISMWKSKQQIKTFKTLYYRREYGW